MVHLSIPWNGFLRALLFFPKRGEIDEGDEDNEYEEENEEGENDEDDEETEEDSGSETEDYEYEEAEENASDENVESCPICLNGLRDQDVGTPESCDHIFCLECIVEWSKVLMHCRTLLRYIVNWCFASFNMFNTIFFIDPIYFQYSL